MALLVPSKRKTGLPATLSTLPMAALIPAAEARRRRSSFLRLVVTGGHRYAYWNRCPLETLDASSRRYRFLQTAATSPAFTVRKRKNASNLKANTFINREL